MIDGPADTFLPRAVRTTVIVRICLDPVPDHLASAMGTHRCQLVDRAFETIENMAIPGCDDLERQIIIVTANFALRHSLLLTKISVGFSFKNLGEK